MTTAIAPMLIQDAPDGPGLLTQADDGKFMMWDGQAKKMIMASIRMGGGGINVLRGGANVDLAISTAIATHVAAADPHTGYLLATGGRTGATSQAQSFTNGITSAVATSFTDHNPTLSGTGTAYGYYVQIYQDGTGGGGQNAFFRAGGTLAVPSATLSGMALGSFSFRGHTGAAFTGSKALITAQASEDWTVSANGTRMQFQTTANGSTTLTTRMFIANDGNVGFGGQTSPTATAHFGASTTARASACIPHGTAPASPVNGDVWTTTTAFLLRLNGTTKNVAVGTTGAAFTQTFSTADRTIAAYTSDPESSAYTGLDNLQVGTPYAKLTDLNALRTAYETLRVFAEDIGQALNAAIDDLQAFSISG